MTTTAQVTATAQVTTTAQVITTAKVTTTPQVTSMQVTANGQRSSVFIIVSQNVNLFSQRLAVAIDRKAGPFLNSFVLARNAVTFRCCWPDSRLT